MTRFVVDARTLLRVLESGRTVPPAHQLVAPASIRSQVMDLLLQKVQHGDLTEQEALAVHEQLTETKLRLLNDRVSRRTAWDIARQQGWDTIGNAECIALVKLQADALMTIDADLAAAAAKLVPVAALERLFET
ncbi:MAG TPA: type II toxin-antitoxin system VapC family toxin [Propionibacterium sp.]|nr:type II toxin-antitoxin system VapC family toxin [Propionibacterium sp.]